MEPDAPVDAIKTDLDDLVQKVNQLDRLSPSTVIATAYFVHGSRLLIDAADDSASDASRAVLLRPVLESFLRAHALARDPDLLGPLVAQSWEGRGVGRWFGKGGYLRDDEYRRAQYDAAKQQWSDILGVDDLKSFDFSPEMLSSKVDGDLWNRLETARQQLSHLQQHVPIQTVEAYLEHNGNHRLLSQPRTAMVSAATLEAISELAGLASTSIHDAIDRLGSHQ